MILIRRARTRRLPTYPQDYARTTVPVYLMFVPSVTDRVVIGKLSEGLTVTGSPALRAFRNELTAYFNANTDRLTQPSTNLSGLVSGTDRSILLRVTPLALSASFVYAAGNGTVGFTLKHSSISNRWGFYDGSLRSSGEALTAGQTYTLMVCYGSDNSVRFYRDGSLVGSTTSAAAWGNQAWAINDFGSGGSLGTQGHIHFMAILDKVSISDAKARELTANPSSLFYEIGSVVPIDAAGTGGIPTLTGITLSNITTSGYRATVTA